MYKRQLYKDAISIDEFKKITKLNDSQLNLYANHLSGGQQRILDFGLCLIGKPKLLILDEPTAAMDVEMREHFWTMIGKLKKENVSIFYTSHYIEEVERMADKVIFLDPVSYTHLTLPTIAAECRSRWWPYH